MMEIFNKKKLIEALTKATADQSLQEKVLKYYHLLRKTNATVTKDNFEKLIVKNADGTISTFEQDAARDLFQHRMTVPVEEFFVYQFVKHINKIEIDDSKDFPWSLKAYYRPTDKCIKIRKHSLENHIRAYMQDAMSMTDANIKAQHVIESKYEILLDHELSHLLETKSYNNGEIIQVGLHNVVYININGEYHNFDKTNNVLDFTQNREDITNFEILKHQGCVYISEILNDIFSGVLNGRFAEKEQIPTAENLFLDKTYGIRVIDGSFANGEYALSYDVFEFLKNNVPDFKILYSKINTKKFIDSVNQLPVSENALSMNQAVLAAEGVENIDKATFYDLICINTGIAMQKFKEGNLVAAASYKELNSKLFQTVGKTQNFESVMTPNS